MTEVNDVSVNAPLMLSQVIEAVLAKHGCEETVISFTFEDGMNVDVYRNDGDFDEVTDAAARELYTVLRKVAYVEDLAT